MLPSKLLLFNYQGFHGDMGDHITQKGSANKETKRGLTMSLQFHFYISGACIFVVQATCNFVMVWLEKNCDLSPVSCLFNCTNWLSKIVAWKFRHLKYSNSIYFSKLCHFSLDTWKPRFKRYLHLTLSTKKKNRTLN